MSFLNSIPDCVPRGLSTQKDFLPEGRFVNQRMSCSGKLLTFDEGPLTGVDPRSPLVSVKRLRRRLT